MIKSAKTTTVDQSAQRQKVLGVQIRPSNGQCVGALMVDASNEGAGLIADAADVVSLEAGCRLEVWQRGMTKAAIVGENAEYDGDYRRLWISWAS